MSHNPKTDPEQSAKDQRARSQGYRDSAHHDSVQDALDAQASDNVDALRTAEGFLKASKR